jgi:hypothetical protein
VEARVLLRLFIALPDNRGCEVGDIFGAAPYLLPASVYGVGVVE